MPSDSLNMDELSDERRKGIEKSIKPISVDELKQLGEKLFPYFDHPWRTRFFEFIAENKDASFFHATTHDHVHVIYCREKNNGMWFLPESGMGPLQAKGLAILKEIAEKK